MKKIMLLLLPLLMIGCQKDLHEETPFIPRNSTEEIREGLMDLYHATDGEHWFSQPNWMTARNLEDFDFVTIDGELGSGCFGITLSLEYNDLCGELPESLFELPLFVLDMSNNMLYGKLPENMGANGMLKEVNLENNDLEGTLPASLAKSPSVKVNVSHNKMSGEIPETVLESCFNFKHDFWLYPQKEPYGFTVPDKQAPVQRDVDALLEIYNAIPSQERVPLAWNSTQPEYWDGVTWGMKGRCVKLELDGVSMPTVPECINKLDALRHLHLGGMSISKMPPIDSLKELRNLELPYNSLQEVPEGLGKLVNLNTLDLSENKLIGPFPEELNQLTQLTSLQLRINHFTGIYPDLSGLVNLRVLDLSFLDRMSPQPFPEWLAKLKKLEFLDMSSGNLYGENIDRIVPQMHNLRILKIMGNKLSGSLQHTFDGLHQLSEIYLSSNLFSCPLPEFAPGNQIKEIHLDSNVMTGGIPASWQYLKKLETLDISHNKITGNIPDFMCDLANLNSFYCFMNLMGGEMSDKLKEMMPYWAITPQRGDGFYEPVEDNASADL